jgi:hypothetical protein
MAATSIVAGEQFTDSPECVCPTITSALIQVNDACPTNEIRERLLGHLPWMIIGTRGDTSHLVKRAELFAAYATESAAESAAAAKSAEWASAAAKSAEWASAEWWAARAARAAAEAAEAREASRCNAWEAEMKKFINFIEQEIIPVYTTMPVEPGCNVDKLITA